MSNISNTVSNIYNHIAPAHRAIWRRDIFFWLSLAFWYANNPRMHSFANMIVYIVLFLGFSIFDIGREFRNPQPNDLKFSAPHVAKYLFALLAVLATVIWTIIHLFSRTWDNWPWLLFALTATGVAYLLRPQPKY